MAAFFVTFAVKIVPGPGNSGIRVFLTQPVTSKTLIGILLASSHAAQYQRAWGLSTNHAVTLIVSVSLSLSLSLTHTLSLYLNNSLTHTLPRSPPLSHTLSHTHTFFHSRAHTLSHSQTISR